MQNQQSTTTESSTSKNRYWLAAVIMLIIVIAIQAILLMIYEHDYRVLKVNTSILLAEVNGQLREANELARQRQEEIDLSKQQQQTLQGELAASLTVNEELTTQVGEAQVKAAKQSELIVTIEKQRKINADSAEIQRKLLHSTFKQLYREQKEDPDYSAVNLLDYAASQIKSAARRKSPEAEAKIRSQFSWIYSNGLNEYEGSEKQAALAATSRKQLLGEDHLDTIDSLQRLGNAQHNQGKYKLAVDTFNEALSGARKLFGNDHAETLQVLEYLVSPLERLKRFDDLVIARQEILRIRKLKPSRSKSSLHYTMLRLGNALRETKRFEEAEAMFRDLLESCLSDSGPDDSSTFEAKVCLAWTLRLQDKVDEADRLNKQLTSLAEFMAAIHRSFSDEMYGQYLSYLGKFQQSENLLLRNFNYKKNSSNYNRGSDLNTSIDALIELYEAWSKPKEAEQMRKQLITPDLNSG